MKAPLARCAARKAGPQRRGHIIIIPESDAKNRGDKPTPFANGAARALHDKRPPPRCSRARARGNVYIKPRRCSRPRRRKQAKLWKVD